MKKLKKKKENKVLLHFDHLKIEPKKFKNIQDFASSKKVKPQQEQKCSNIIVISRPCATKKQ